MSNTSPINKLTQNLLDNYKFAAIYKNNNEKIKSTNFVTYTGCKKNTSTNFKGWQGKSKHTFFFNKHSTIKQNYLEPLREGILYSSMSPKPLTRSGTRVYYKKLKTHYLLMKSYLSERYFQSTTRRFQDVILCALGPLL